jgi:hypothetical protein
MGGSIAFMSIALREDQRAWQDIARRQQYSAADVGALIEASERVCKLVALEPEHGSGALVRNARSRALG